MNIQDYKELNIQDQMYHKALDSQAKSQIIRERESLKDSQLEASLLYNGLDKVLNGIYRAARLKCELPDYPELKKFSKQFSKLQLTRAHKGKTKLIYDVIKAYLAKNSVESIQLAQKTIAKAAGCSRVFVNNRISLFVARNELLVYEFARSKRERSEMLIYALHGNALKIAPCKRAPERAFQKHFTPLIYTPSLTSNVSKASCLRDAKLERLTTKRVVSLRSCLKHTKSIRLRNSGMAKLSKYPDDALFHADKYLSTVQGYAPSFSKYNALAYRYSIDHGLYIDYERSRLLEAMHPVRVGYGHVFDARGSRLAPPRSQSAAAPRGSRLAPPRGSNNPKNGMKHPTTLNEGGTPLRKRKFKSELIGIDPYQRWSYSNQEAVSKSCAAALVSGREIPACFIELFKEQAMARAVAVPAPSRQESMTLGQIARQAEKEKWDAMAEKEREMNERRKK